MGHPAATCGSANQPANLSSELPEVVVDVFVHPEGPFVGGEFAEEAVRMGGATGRTGSGEAVDDAAEFFSFDGEVALVGDLEAGNGGRIAAHGFVLFERHRLDHKPNEAADQHAWRTAVAEGQLHAYGAVRHGLRGCHLAPQARAVGAQAREAVFQLLHGLGLKQVLHEGTSPSEDDSRRWYQRQRPAHRDHAAMNGEESLQPTPNWYIYPISELVAGIFCGICRLFSSF